MNRRLFLSYTRDDREVVLELDRNLQKSHNSTWMDQRLDGGQEWWEEVLRQIREADALILCLTPNVLESVASLEEVKYAQQLGKPVLPVMLKKTPADVLPANLARLQVVDATEANKDAPWDLLAALDRLPDAPTLPDPLPDSPPAPVSYLSDLGTQIQASVLPLDQQWAIVGQLSAGLQRPKERDSVRILIDRLRSRDDLFIGPARKLHEVLIEADRFRSMQAQQQPPAVANSAMPPPNQGYTRPALQPSSVDPPQPKKRRGLKLLGVVLLGGAAVATGAVALNGRQLGPVNPYPPPSYSPSSTPAPTPARVVAAAVGDECLIGHWKSTASSGTFTVSQVTFAMQGGSGATLTVTRDGAAQLDYNPSDPFLLTAADGTEVAMQLSGATTSRMHASSGGEMQQTLATNGVVADFTMGGKPVRQATTATPWLRYVCTSAQLTVADAEQAMAFARQ
ncbi:toll/interleukin-1 receptor domain-containing protein [Lapillicoccus sp.]|uniref:toll/interleukin-1 receptor domain-containing protein n=1 Tax=Lapillicoccus sp. TaxID=1909287 RepID=UPI0032651F7F